MLIINNYNNNKQIYIVIMYFKFYFKTMITNIGFLLLISLILIIGGWAFKALIAFAQGKPIVMNLKNPLNLKARWPKDTKEGK